MSDENPQTPPTPEAIGLLETRGLVAALVACDAMLKTARVRLLQQQVTRPALVTVCITGEVSAVAEALTTSEGNRFEASGETGGLAAAVVGCGARPVVMPGPPPVRC